MILSFSWSVRFRKYDSPNTESTSCEMSLITELLVYSRCKQFKIKYSKVPALPCPTLPLYPYPYHQSYDHTTPNHPILKIAGQGWPVVYRHKLRYLMTHTSNLKRWSFGIQHPKFENRRLGLIESVHESYWKMQHPSRLLALGWVILSFQLNVEPNNPKGQPRSIIHKTPWRIHNAD